MVRVSRNTKQKELLNKEISKMKSFFSSEDLFKIINKKDPKIGIATVYRFLNEKVKEKKLYSYVCGKKNLYSKGKKNHCHFVCEETGKIIHFELDNLDFLKNIQNKIPGKINSFQLEIKGVCNKCKD